MTWTIAALDADSTLLTVNNRLAAELRTRYDRLQLTAGRRVWPTADILPWSAWLRRHYELLLDSGFTDRDLLSPAQERLLWQEIVEQHATPSGLLRPGAAADSASASYALLHDWQLDRHPLASLGGDETRAFLNWREAFEEQLAWRGLLSAAQLPDLLHRAFAQTALPVPRRLVYSGFDALSPTQQALFGLLRELGCDIVEHTGDSRRSEPRRVAVTDSEAEIRLAAAWAHERLQRHPEQRIAVVATQIGQQRRELQRLFSEMTAPATYLGQTNRRPPFNLSLGEPLSDCALVAHALLALALIQGEQPLNSIGQLLRSPFIGAHAGEWEGRALCDATLRRDGIPRLDLRQLAARLGRFERTDLRHCPDLLARLAAVIELRGKLPRHDTPNRWAGHLKRLLGALGWPGGQALDSHEYQQHERAQRLFSDLAGLGKVRPRMSFAEAVGQLRALAGDAVFQAESAPAPIQILGPLEAAGMDFDATWLLGMDDQNWPPAPRPDPLLPTELQRQLGMPHASAARELDFARSLLERLACSAPLVIASHAGSAGEREQRVSPLVQDWPLVEAQAVVGNAVSDLRTACAKVERLEALPAAQAGSAPAEPRGGAGLLAAQASCPFQAVARYRLGARPLDEPSTSADGALLGTLVHALLQRVWQRLRDSHTLAATDNSAVQALLEPLAAATLDDIGRRRPDLFTPRFRAIERARLSRLLGDWLELERRRTQSFEVLALEQDRVIELCGLQLSTRADRVDRLADGSLAIIDYKTGRSVGRQGWFDERLTEPQLPLYCLHEAGDVGAALLARVRRDDRGCQFIGLSRAADVAPGVDVPDPERDGADWPGMLTHWQRALTGLADEIAAGRADPTPSRQACEYCPLGALCRVQEMLREDAGD